MRTFTVDTTESMASGVTDATAADFADFLSLTVEQVEQLTAAELEDAIGNCDDYRIHDWLNRHSEGQDFERHVTISEDGEVASTTKPAPVDPPTFTITYGGESRRLLALMLDIVAVGQNMLVEVTARTPSGRVRAYAGKLVQFNRTTEYVILAPVDENAAPTGEPTIHLPLDRIVTVHVP